MTLDEDVESLVRQRMTERRVSFEQAVNDVIREAATRSRASGAFETSTFDLGVPTVVLDRALQLAAELEDDEAVRELRVGR